MCSSVLQRSRSRGGESAFNVPCVGVGSGPGSDARAWLGVAECFMIRRLRILIVDDKEQTRRTIKQLLSFVEGVEVVGLASDGVEALAQVRKVHPDCILMDVNMPRMDGLEAVRRLRVEFPHIYVIMMSVDDTPRLRRDVNAVGASAFLTKPLCIDTLTHTLGMFGATRISV